VISNDALIYMRNLWTTQRVRKIKTVISRDERIYDLSHMCDGLLRRHMNLWRLHVVEIL